jgi:putative sigma-54 modulation protein
MKFVFTDKKVTLPKSVHAYAEKKVGKLDRYFKSDAEAAVTFSVEKGRNKAEITVRSGGTILRVSESTSDMFASIDAAVADIERQLRKNKARLGKRLRQGAFDQLPGMEPTSFVPEDEDEDAPYRIVRTKSFPIKPMNREEAILQMNLLDHTFFAFRDEESNGAFAVVYKRDNGDYGIIEDIPE